MEEIINKMAKAIQLKDKNYRLLRILEHKLNNYNSEYLFTPKNEIEDKLKFRCILDLKLEKYIKNKAKEIINYE